MTAKKTRPEKKKLLPLPEFQREEDEREFWASHDSADYVDWSHARKVTFPNLKLSTETISLRLPAGLLSDLKILANRADVPYQSLMKLFLAERVRQELTGGWPASTAESIVREPEAPYGSAAAGTHRKPRR